jgi:enediyne biosynthesis protein E5
MRIGDGDWQDRRRQGLRRFAFAITLLNVLGHVWFGFEQSFAQPLAAMLAAYGTEILLEVVDSRIAQRRPRFRGGPVNLVDFLLSAHITALACAMLLYANNRLLPIVFAAVTGIASKSLFRYRTPSGQRHFLNPSNFGISMTLLLFPWVGTVPPYHFTENLEGAGDWILPGLIVVTGSLMNTRFTRRIPVVAGWVTGFVCQAALRSWIFSRPLIPTLVPMTGVAFILYTFYMVTDPATTPQKPRSQILFGASVAGAYGLLVSLHAVFGLSFGLAIVCCCRGMWLCVRNWIARKESREATAEPVLIGAQP